MDNIQAPEAILYGIKNCDTVKKARKWLSEAEIDHRFHDLRSDGLSEAQLDEWLATLGWEAMLNTRGTTFRALPEEQKSELTLDKARALMLAQPAMIKRPLLAIDGHYHLGFKPEQYHTLFSR